MSAKKKVIILISIVVVSALVYSFSVFAVNRWGNPFVDNKSQDDPVLAAKEVLDDYVIDEMNLNSCGGLIVCHKSNETYIRWLLIDEKNKWYDATENVIYCKDLITQDDQDGEPYRVKVLNFRGQWYCCIKQFDYSWDNLLNVKDSLNTKQETSIPKIDGEVTPLWFWCIHDMPNDYTITVNEHVYTLDNK